MVWYGIRYEIIGLFGEQKGGERRLKKIAQ
jgi:hypothetical protein